MKWRKVKKHNKKYVVPVLIGQCVGIDPVSGCPIKIVDVKLRNAGNGRIAYDYTYAPLYPELFEEGRKKLKETEFRGEGKYGDLLFRISEPDEELVKVFGCNP